MLMGVRVEGHIGTFTEVDSIKRNNETLFLMESDIYGDDAPCIIINKSLKLVMDDVWNGFDDYFDSLY